MKKYIYALATFGVLTLFFSCSATEQLALNTIEPSPVTLEHTIKRIGIINPSQQEVATQGNMKIDYILAAEKRWFNENGTDAAITGLFDQLLKDERFEVVEILNNVPEEVQKIGQAPSEGEWSSIKELCELYQVDAIFSLAFFDTDTKISLKKTKMESTDMMRDEKQVAAQELTLETFIENGWRIFDPKNRVLIDDIVLMEQIVSKGKGETVSIAYFSIENRREAMLAVSKNNGSNYGQRLLPQESTVYRDYYVKGSNSFVAAGEKAAAGNWIDAIALWEQETQSSNTKLKSRAYHNLAVASEKSENLNEALTLANLALEAHDDQIYHEYISKLEMRIKKLPILQKQLTAIEFSN
ncbi:DUF6340 family protein [bacterium]|nr:DUF6340 family protein [bacterium]